MSLANCDIGNSSCYYPEKLEESCIQCNNLWRNRSNLVQNVLLDAAVCITLANDVSITLICHSRLLVYIVRCSTLRVRGIVRGLRMASLLELMLWGLMKWMKC